LANFFSPTHRADEFSFFFSAAFSVVDILSKAPDKVARESFLTAEQLAFISR
jgi:hypothetical protein